MDKGSTLNVDMGKIKFESGFTASDVSRPEMWVLLRWSTEREFAFSPQSFCCRLESTSPICMSTQQRGEMFSWDVMALSPPRRCTSSERPWSRYSCGWVSISGSLAVQLCLVGSLMIFSFVVFDGLSWWGVRTTPSGLPQLWMRHREGDEIERAAYGRYKYYITPMWEKPDWLKIS